MLQNPLQTLLKIDFNLNANGIANFDNVLYFFSSYINFVKKEALQESIFNEFKIIQENRFKYSIKEGKPMEEAYSFARKLSLYPTKYVLGGDTLVFSRSINTKLIEEVINKLTIDNAIVLLGFKEYFNPVVIPTLTKFVLPTGESASSSLFANVEDPVFGSGNGLPDP